MASTIPTATGITMYYMCSKSVKTYTWLCKPEAVLARGRNFQPGAAANFSSQFNSGPGVENGTGRVSQARPGPSPRRRGLAQPGPAITSLVSARPLPTMMKLVSAQPGPAWLGPMKPQPGPARGTARPSRVV